MIGADPAPYTIAGAFVLGAVLAGLAVVRVVRAVMTERRRDERERGLS